MTVAKDGQEAFELVKESMEQRKFFNLIFMDVQVREKNKGHENHVSDILMFLFRCPILMAFRARS